jgi:hypothetical protein
MFSSVIAEEGIGIFYLFDYYWLLARKHVAVIFQNLSLFFFAASRRLIG